MPISIAISEGDRIPFVAEADISAGDIVLLADKPLPATHDVATGEEGSLATEGLFEIDKEATTITFARGDNVYWDVADNECNDDSTNNKLIGWAYVAAGATDATVKIKLAQATA
jgi:predicted RecA/RadA family phage recombinase